MKKRALILTAIGLTVCAGLALFYFSLTGSDLERFPVDTSETAGLFSPQEDDFPGSVSMPAPSEQPEEVENTPPLSDEKPESSTVSGYSYKAPSSSQAAAVVSDDGNKQVQQAGDGKPEEIKGKWVDNKYQLPNGSYASGLTVIDGKLYAFDAKTNEMLTGRQTFEGKHYHFDFDTGVALSGWLSDPDDASVTYYYSKEGPALTGLQLFTDGNRYYFHPATGARQSGLQTVAGKIYYFAGKNDSALKEWQDVPATENTTAQVGIMAAAETASESDDTNRYFFSSTEHYALTGVQTLSDKIYAFSDQGVQLTGWQLIDPNLYSFTGAGNSALVSQWAQHPQGSVYLGADGAAYKGLKEVSGNLYYFGPVVSEGWLSVGGDTYSFTSATSNPKNAALKKQWAQNPAHDRKSYLGADGKACKGVQTVEDKLYGFAEDGEMMVGKQTIGGKVYFFDDTSGVAKTGWLPNGVAGDSYYVGSEGYALTGVQKIGDAYYYFRPSDALQQSGLQEYNGKTYYFDGTSGKAVIGAFSPDGMNHYYFGSDGAAKTGVLEIGGAYYYYNTSGLRRTGWQKHDGSNYYFDPETAKAKTSAWFTDIIQGGMYYFGADGRACTGTQTIGDASYTFDENGKLISGDAGSWVQDGGKTYYVYPDGSHATGLCDIGGAKYYFDENGVRQNGWVSTGGRKYYFDPANKDMAKAGWFVDANAEGKPTYYFGADGAAYTGIRDIDADLYAFDNEGAMRTGVVTQGGARYYFGSDGKAATGWRPGVGDAEARYYDPVTRAALTGMQQVDGKLYLFDDTGLRQGGWHTDENGLKYYFRTTGDMSAVTGQYDAGNGKNYHFAPEGYAYVGLVYAEDSGAWYYFDGEGLRQSGWQAVGGKRYYFGEGGKARTGFAELDGATYYFDPESAFAYVGMSAEIEGKLYEFDPDGKLVGSAPSGGAYNWKDVDGVPHYVNADGAPYAVGLAQVDGFWYWFSEQGAAQKGWKEKDGSRYFFGEDYRAMIGWHKDGDDTYYFGADGAAYTGDNKTIGGKSYSFDEKGVLKTGEAPDFNKWGVNDGGKPVYYDENGQLAVGLKQIGGAWYYFDPDGVRQSGWQTLDSGRYYFGEDGKGYTGWQEVEDRWYLFDAKTARQQTGWQYRPDGSVTRTHYFAADGSAPLGHVTLNGVARYFFPDGHMAIGWETIGEDEYYFHQNGSLATGVVTVEGELCSFDADGKRAQGWNTDSQGYRYHFTGKNAASGWTLVENRWYRFDASTSRQLTGWQYRINGDDSYTFYYYSNGSLPDAGPQTVGGVARWFFADGHMAVGWEVIEGSLYHFAKNGEKTTGTTTIEGVSYPFGSDGKLEMGWVTSGGARYHIGEKGADKGWTKIDGVWHRFDDDNAAQKTGWQTRTAEDGKTYRHYYSAAGTASVGWTGAGNQRRYFRADGSAAAGWQVVDNKDYYFLADGLMATGVVDIDGTPHSFDENGELIQGWNTDGKGNRYYFTENGALKGWEQVEDRWYHFDEDTGAQQLGWQARSMGGGVTLYYYYFANGSLPAAGWNTAIDGTRRYVMEDGQLGQGFVTIDGKRMCLDEKGVSLTGWQQIDGRWYVMDANGVQQTGWQTRKVDKSNYEALYFYYEDGTLPPAGWNDDVEGERRYVMADGELAKGWITIDSFKYYFQEGGIPLTGRHTIDGTEYYFDELGRLVAGPVIDSVKVGSGSSTRPVTVTATVSSLLKDKSLQYSFDGGATWGTANFASFKAGTTIAAGTIRVRDSAGSITKYNTKVTIPNIKNHGIDVSKYQGNIDWAKVAASGQVDFAIIRSLCWDSGNNSYGIDPYFETNVRQAKKYGIKVGTYLYSYAFKDSEMKQEIEYFMNSSAIKRLMNEKIYFDLPVFIDYEDPLISKNTANQTIVQRTQTVRYGMNLIEQLSKKQYGTTFLPGFYVNKSWATSMINGAQLQAEGYEFWLARWNDTGHGWSPAPALWQYSNGSGKSSIPGISGNVDRNWMYKDYTGIIDGGSSGGTAPGNDGTRKITVTNQSTGKQVTGSAADILAQIVMAEVGGFENAEVYKAQAVAAQAWIINQNSQGYMAPRVALKTPTAAVKTAVNTVLDKTLTYNGQPALTPYFAWSNGKTNAATYWNASNNLPYLKTVDSSYDATVKSAQKYTISEANLKAKLKTVYGYDVTAGYSPSDWIKITSRNSGGYATSLNVCSRTPKVDYFITTMFPGIGSPDFTVSYSGGTFTFTYKGYGHCIGMSQYGAYGLAAKGYTYDKILAHYYPGTTLSTV